MHLAELVRLSLQEDVGPGDLTTLACVEPGATGRAVFLAKQELVVSGHDAAAEVFRQLGAAYRPLIAEGQVAAPRALIAEAEGPVRALITGERTALNFLMRLCGIATHVRACVAQAAEQGGAQGGAQAGGREGRAFRVVDTRKTTPLHRALEKQAVRAGGAHNHRFGLYDGLFIKDNHIVAAGGIAQAVARVRAHAHPLLKIEVEVESLEELSQALDAGADVILLDNMDDATLTAAAAICRRHPRGAAVLLEASGNMTGPRLAGLAATGVDYASMGGLIHQARWADVSMRLLDAAGTIR